MNRVAASLGVTLVVAGSAWSGHKPVLPNADVPQVRLPLTKVVPTLDGTIADDEWAGAVRNAGLMTLRGGNLTSREAAFWLACDGTRLYLAVRSELPPDGQVLNRAVPNPRQDVTAAFADDSLELVLDPKRGRREGDRRFYHIIVNGRLALFDRSIDPDNPRNPQDLAWRLEGMELKHSAHDGWWDVEAAIPLAALGVTAADFATPWGLRICRNWRRPGEQSQWEANAPSYEDQPSMPLVQWDAAAPVVQVLSLQEGWQRARLAVAVRNPHVALVAVRVHLADAWHFNPPTEREAVVTVPPGGVETTVLEAPDGGPAGPHRTVVRVASADGATVYYQREVRWTLHRPPANERWSIGEESRKAVALGFKYYPYHNQVRLRVDLGSLPLRDKITGGSAEIRPQAAPAAEPLWRQALAFGGDVAEGTYAIPDLPDGTYRLAVRLSGEGAPAVPVTEDFERRHYEWEHNRLGITDEVMPPFTPMTVQGTTVGCILREHRHGAAGLWDSLVSEGRELLAAPMRWEVETAAGVATVEGAGWKATRQAPTAVAGEARWQAGALKALTRTEYDVDGMMLVTLTLDAAPTTDVRRLSLVIPLRDAECRYLHGCGDGLRHNAAGFVPPGEGTVWDSSKGNKLEIPGTFYPYLWVGGGARGLCWCADTDRDWRLDDATPTVALVRQGDVLTLRVSPITRPGLLDRPRTLVFALQATPTKPMPEGWRRWVGSKPVPGGRTVSWLGSCYYWGAHSYDVYPHEKRFDYYEALAKARQTGTPNATFIKDWMAMLETIYPNDGKPYSANGYEFYRAHINAGHHTAAGAAWAKDWRLFGYTNARGVGFHAPEFRTFQDEWLRYAWFRRDWDPKGDVGYDLSPSESFVDYAVWYYRKMLQTWADGVYWDNTFLSAHYDPVVGNAWTDEKGEVHPGLGLFHLRNLIKRTAIMMWQESRGVDARRLPFISLSHMTNTMIVPILSFGNCTMDWEWKYGYDDFQDRFSPDLTVAETLGRQVGSWGTILAGGHPDPKDPRTARVFRTRLAVCLVHELQNFDYQPKQDTDLYAKLFAFGYGLPDCRVFNYWDAPHPAAVTGADARTLVMARGGQAIVAVADYGGGGACTLTLTPDAVGVAGTASATDLESGAAVERVGPGAYRFDLPAHDLRVIRVGP